MDFDLLPEPMLNGRQVADILNIDVRELRKREANECAPRSVVQHGLRKYPKTEVRRYILEMAQESGWQIDDTRLCRMEVKLERMTKR